MDLLLLLAALVGHVFFWVGLVNRIHGLSMPQWLCKAVLGLGAASIGLIPIAFGYWFAAHGFGVLTRAAGFRIPWPASLYLALCWLAAAATLFWWVWGRLLHRPYELSRYHRTQRIDLAEASSTRAAEDEHHLLVRIPGNQALELDVGERALRIPRLPAPLDGLAILHLSDFHFTGRLGKAYFQEVVRLSSQCEPELVLITGDIVDRAEYIDWVPETVGRLTARYGLYFVLGNHDRDAGVPRIRRTLTDLGLVDLGGRWLLARIRGEPVLLAGNELPWIRPAADLRDAPPPASEGGPLRIVLAHSPDQLGWARTNQIDLLLAGHTHGGQIRLPGIGPILTPSFSGVRYSSGVFHAPPTVMHVTRGVSGEFPIRLNCPPEITKLILHAENT